MLDPGCPDPFSLAGRLCAIMVDFSKLVDKSVSYGIGGKSDDYLVPARLLFLEKGVAI
jgi:hypothetical protein